MKNVYVIKISVMWGLWQRRGEEECSKTFYYLIKRYKTKNSKPDTVYKKIDILI